MLFIMLYIFFLDSWHNSPELDTAIANGSIEIIKVLAILTLYNFKEEVFKLFRRNINVKSSKFRIKLCFTFNNIFFSFFLFKPRTNLALCLTCADNIKPISLWTAILLSSYNFYYFAILNLIINWYNSLIYLCTNHSVANLGMNSISNIYYCCTCWQADNITLWSKYKNFFRN